jgi:hypothetical protein
VSEVAKPASFEEFLEASTRLSKQGEVRAGDSGSEAAASAAKPHSACRLKRPMSSSQKVKVGLTIDEGLVDAVDDYIYHARKQGRRLKKNDVYEAALRQFLEAEGVDIR